MVMDSNSELKPTADLLMGRKLRPLIPRLSTPSCCCTQNSKVLAWSRSDHCVRREMRTGMAALVSTRWNPTAEQLQGLEEIYRRGIRTPSAEQIQQIAAKLGRFGKIEGKNVFYWFQNHKARERQKTRRQLELLSGKKMHHKQTAGLNKRYFEIEHHREGLVPSNCSSTPSEE